MNISEIIQLLNTSNRSFPRHAVSAAINMQAEITPVLLKILRSTIENYDAIDSERSDYLFALFLLSKFRERAAFSYIIQMARIPEESLEELLGDLITEDFPRFIVSTFDDNLSMIKALIEDESVYRWCRDAALRSLLGLVAINKLSREDAIAYLKELFVSPLARQMDFVTSLVCVAVDLYPEELLEEIKSAFSSGNVDEDFIDMKYVNSAIKRGKHLQMKMHVYDELNHLPVDDVEKSMSSMNIFRPASKTYEAPIYVEARETPKIGRNESCPCNSGKKYKKCCLEELKL